MLRKIVTYNSQKYAGTLGSGLLMALDIMQLFYSHCTISGMYKEVGGDGVGGERGWAARGRSYLLLEHM